ncbi:MAG: terminase family protein [Planctomycetes bacterium]|nr:terminase family protein [Planctomycetota bacterium]
MTSCSDSAPAPDLSDLEQIADFLDEHWERPPAALALRAVRQTDFDPWWGQRLALRSPATWRVLVAARQVGKSYLAVQLVLQTALERPGSKSILLVPTLRHARQPIALLRERCRDVPGCEWNATDRRMTFQNGSVWEVYSAEREGSTRGLTITGLLWADEAALIPIRAWNEILPASGNALKLLTTTPAGKNWVYDEFVSGDAEHESFRFRSSDSPHVNHAEIERCRASMTPEFAAQEFEAEFVDGLILAFPDTAGLFVGSLPERSLDEASVGLGIDLGKEQDWTVVTRINSLGEAEILGRWRHEDYPTTTQRIVDLIVQHGVSLVCVDKAQAGSYLADELRRIQRERKRKRDGFPLEEVVAYETFSQAKKTVLIETARGDVQHQRLKVLRNDLAPQLHYELRRFQGIKRVSQGREIVSYGCPQIHGEHDDCVLSLCLANWARLKLLERESQPARQIDIAKFVRFNARWARENPGLTGGGLFGGGRIFS